ncbi:MAG: type II secretion system ATPase GspE [Deltaproteobacteria bacterium]|nr:type II secretion system ATPase GspE [Deltaproteobacteria bacterium]MCB9785187.1 type II secretion system ATPase GspE [Deltaproteobacteria bacterium]
MAVAGIESRPGPRRIGEILVEMGVASDASVQNALEVQRDKGGRLGEILMAMQAVDERDVARALSSQLGLRYTETLDADRIDPKLVSGMTLGYVRQNGFLPLEAPEDEDILRVAVSDPLNVAAVDDLRVLFNREVELVVAPASAVQAAMHRVFDRRAGADQVVDDLNEEDLGTIAHDLEEQTKDILDEDDEAPIIRLVNSILNQAIKERASDIHIEPFERSIMVRFRKDGVLKEIVQAPKRFQASIASRIKIMGNLNIAEKRLPQDGRIRIKIAGRDVDLRLSTVPTSYGERIVLRILDKQSVILDLTSLGFRDENLRVIETLIERPHGIILVTGPTGSGKTTTLYAALSRINTPDKNILTIEDPVEYQIQGIGQMQVNRKIDFTFARGLRAILRQDPDVVLIGEIRDLETAENAIQAALTGHLVFATLHTNDAPGAFTRLTDMGVEPFLSASSVIAVMGQRLVRQLCKTCREPYVPLRDELEKIGYADPEAVLREHTFYRAAGCEECFGSGYRGRKGIHEMMLVGDEVRSQVMQNAPANVLKRVATEAGMKTLREDGALKVLDGLTTIDEVMRVTAEDH